MTNVQTISNVEQVAKLAESLLKNLEDGTVAVLWDHYDVINNTPEIGQTVQLSRIADALEWFQHQTQAEVAEQQKAKDMPMIDKYRKVFDAMEEQNTIQLFKDRIETTMRLPSATLAEKLRTIQVDKEILLKLLLHLESGHADEEILLERISRLERDPDDKPPTPEPKQA